MEHLNSIISSNILNDSSRILKYVMFSLLDCVLMMLMMRVCKARCCLTAIELISVICKLCLYQ